MKMYGKTVNGKKLLQATAVGLFAMGAAASTLTAQADPFDHAPDWGNRNRDTYKNNHSLRTLEGIVVKDNIGRDFTIRTRRDWRDSDYSKGDRVRVRAQDGEPSRLNEGDLVRVSGYFENNNSNGVFIARSVNIIRQGTSAKNNNRDTVNGTVLDVDRNQRRFVMSSNGDAYTVFSRDTLSSAINRGDRVRVTGDLNNRTVRNARVELIFNNNSGRYGSYSGAQINFAATVLDVRDNSATLRVRADNGKEYSVRWKGSHRYDRNDRVRIYGRNEGGVIIATDVDLIR